MVNKQFPNSLREHRKALGLSQVEVAKMLGLDCADRISHWERGSALPNIVNLFKLAKIYKTTPQELYKEFFETSKV